MAPAAECDQILWNVVLVKTFEFPERIGSVFSKWGKRWFSKEIEEVEASS